MPMDRKRYPANWQEISRRIRERDGQKCKFCGVANHSLIRRDPDGTFHDYTNDPLGGEVAELADGEKLTKIILTVAHLGTPLEDGSPGDKHNKMDCRDENLAALCQKCHLAYDADEHKANAAKTRLSKKAVGALPGLFD
jgi:5-methylcytosine-specific restriction endonuclease McrA